MKEKIIEMLCEYDNFLTTEQAAIKFEAFVNLEVEKRIAERMSDEEIRIIALNFAPPVIYYGVTGGEDVNLSIRQDIIKLLTQLRSRLTNSGAERSQKTEGSNNG